MTEVIAEDGSKIKTNLPAEELKDLQVTPEIKSDAAKAAEPITPPATPEAAEPKPEAAKVEPAKESESARPEEPVKPKKASPIANLLNQRHELETSLNATKAELEAERNAKTALEAKIIELSKQPNAASTPDTIEALADKYNVNADLLKEIVDTFRKETPSTELPKEVQQLVEDQRMAKAIAAEHAVFDARLDDLASAFPDEPIKEQKDKLMQLAYSTDKAPDGKPYSNQELSVLYFKYIKPEIEPGKASAESAHRAPVESKVIDFQEIADRDDPKEIANMDDATFAKFDAWLKEKQGLPPLRNPSH